MKIAIAGIYEETENYRNALSSLGAEFICTLKVDESEKCDGLLIPGGDDVDPSLYGQENKGSEDTNPKLDSAQIDIIKRFIDIGKPILGICRGYQILNVYFKGTLIQNLNTCNAHKKINGNDSVHMSTAEEGSFIYNIYGKRLSTNSAHHQGVDRLGQGLRLVQKADDGVAEAFQHEKYPIYGVQWHPERMCFKKAREDTVDGSKVIRFFLDKCSKNK